MCIGNNDTYVENHSTTLTMRAIVIVIILTILSNMKVKSSHLALGCPKFMVRSSSQPYEDKIRFG